MLTRTRAWSAGTSSASSAGVASPRRSRAASVAASASRIQASASSTPRSSTSWRFRRRSVRATPSEAAAWRIGASSTATTNIVRRIASIRTSRRSSYSARSRSSMLMPVHAGPRREVDRGRVGRVQADDPASGLDDIASAVSRRQVVADGDPTPALRDRDRGPRGHRAVRDRAALAARRAGSTAGCRGRT